MANLLDIARTGIGAASAGLSTTGHNIANVNTDGYHRQRVDLDAVSPQQLGGHRFGLGVQVADVQRLADRLLSVQRRSAASDAEGAQRLGEIGEQVSRLFGESGHRLDEALAGYFSAVREAAQDPSSTPLRSVLLLRAEELGERLRGLDGALANLAADAAPQLRGEVEEVNRLAAALAGVNRHLQTRYGADNDLLDQRDALLDQLAERVAIDTRTDPHGAVSVSLAKGQTIVQDGIARELILLPSDDDPRRLRVHFDSGGEPVDIDRALRGGRLGALAGDGMQLLDDVRGELGELAAGLVVHSNAVHRRSVDRDGEIGQPLFEALSLAARPEPANSGAAALDVELLDAAALADSPLQLRYDGSAWVVENSAGELLASGANLPLEAAGLRFSVRSGAPLAGDGYRVEPRVGLASQVRLAIEEPGQLALASPVRAVFAADNNGTASLRELTVLDPARADLQDSLIIAFDDPPSRYRLLDTAGLAQGPALAWQPGQTIAANGWELAIDGRPAAGDRIRIEANADGRALQHIDALAAAQHEGLLRGGERSLDDHYAALVGEIGSRVAGALSRAETQAQVRDMLDAQLAAKVGVNLDEEATRLLQYQQMFQASSRVIQTVQQTFDTLIQMT